MTLTVETTSGLTFTATPINGAAIRAAEGQSVEQTLRAILANCHIETTHPGPYISVTVGTGKPNWSQLHWYDLFDGVLQIRRASFPQSREQLGLVDKFNEGDRRPMGDVLDFDWGCQRCGKLNEESIDLAEYCRVNRRPMSDEVKAAFRGDHLETTMPNGAKVRWRPSTPDIDRIMREYMRKNGIEKESAVEEIAKHIVHVDALPAKRQDMHGWVRWVMALSGDEIDHLKSDVMGRQQGFDMTVRLRCHECNTEQRQIFPFVSPSFTSPRSHRIVQKAVEQMRATKVTMGESDDREVGATASSGGFYSQA